MNLAQRSAYYHFLVHLVTRHSKPSFEVGALLNSHPHFSVFLPRPDETQSRCQDSRAPRRKVKLWSSLYVQFSARTWTRIVSMIVQDWFLSLRVSLFTLHMCVGLPIVESKAIVYTCRYICVWLKPQNGHGWNRCTILGFQTPRGKNQQNRIEITLVLNCKVFQFLINHKP